jgi:hypothetical protein
MILVETWIEWIIIYSNYTTPLLQHIVSSARFQVK